MRQPNDDPISGLDGAASTADAIPDECLTRVRTITSRSGPSLKETIRALLRMGADRLGTEQGLLADINPGPGTHETAVRSDPASSMFSEPTRDLANTYCRSVIATGEPVRVYDADAQGWTDHPAYQTFGVRCYLGAKVVVNSRLYGTTCFVDRSPREDPFSTGDVALVSLIAQWIAGALKSREGEPYDLASQATLRTDRELLRRVQRVAQVGGWKIDLESGDMTWTAEVYRLHEVPTDVEPDVETGIQFYAPDARPRIREALDRCVEAGTPYDLELPIETAKGNRRWVRTRGEPITDANGTPVAVIGTVQDVTERHTMRRQLREQRDLLTSINENVTEGIFRATPESGILYANQAFADMFGYEDAEEIYALDPTQLYAVPGRRDALWSQAQSLENDTRDVLLQRKDGSTFPARASGSVSRDEDGNIEYIDGVVTDVTEEHRMWEKLLDAQEKERRRVDQEMHDEMAGLLSSLQLMVELADMEAESAGVSLDPLDDIRELTDNLSTVCRTISRRLHPRVLREEGLVPALESLRNRIREQHDLAVHLHPEEELDEAVLSSLMKKTAFHVVQESLLNIVWHAEPDAVQIAVHRNDRALLVRVTGEGTESDRPDQSEGFSSSLDDVRDCVRRLGGTLTVGTSADDETRIAARLPFDISSVPDRAWPSDPDDA
jgi:PAS domain S-box-containing protein